MKTVVLIVDDDPVLAVTYARILEGDSLECLLAHTVSDGLTILESHSVSLLITDLSIEERDGLELVNRVRASDPNLPVTVISGQY